MGWLVTVLCSCRAVQDKESDEGECTVLVTRYSWWEFANCAEIIVWNCLMFCLCCKHSCKQRLSNLYPQEVQPTWEEIIKDRIIFSASNPFSHNCELLNRFSFEWCEVLEAHINWFFPSCNKRDLSGDIIEWKSCHDLQCPSSSRSESDLCWVLLCPSSSEIWTPPWHWGGIGLEVQEQWCL
jgi:hypothetical protein